MYRDLHDKGSVVIECPFDVTCDESGHKPCDGPCDEPYDLLHDAHDCQRYTLSGGAKFGADLLAYPGDPSEFHAQFTVRPVLPDVPINPILLKVILVIMPDVRCINAPFDLDPVCCSQHQEDRTLHVSICCWRPFRGWQSSVHG